VGKPEGLERPVLDGRIILKLILEKGNEEQ
jgi:hypothetical protein